MSFLTYLSMNIILHHDCLFSGEGSFGRVLQAKAEGIVPGMPERNIVAIKTTKGEVILKALVGVYVLC